MSCQAAARLEAEEQQVKLIAQTEFRRHCMIERSQQNYQKHYNMCMEILGQMIELSCKMAEYKELTQGCVYVFAIAATFFFHQINSSKVCKGLEVTFCEGATFS